MRRPIPSFDWAIVGSWTISGTLTFIGMPSSGSRDDRFADERDRQVAGEIVVVAGRVVDAFVRGRPVVGHELVVQRRVEGDRIPAVSDVGPCQRGRDGG